jgi:hypothetical protein
VVLLINNTEFINWKEKLIQRKQLEEATYKNLDDFTETFELKLGHSSTPSNDESQSIASLTKPTNMPPQFAMPPNHEGSLSFTAPSPQFQLPQPQQPMSSNAYLNQSLPTTNPPPGFAGFDNTNNMHSFDNGGGLLAPHLTTSVGMNQFPLQQDPMIHSVQNTGRLKFFDEVQNYGFLIVDGDSSDLFVHYDDLKDAKLSRDILRQAKTNYFLQFSFDIAFYSGKYKESKKGINLKLLKIEKLGIVN